MVLEICQVSDNLKAYIHISTFTPLCKLLTLSISFVLSLIVSLPLGLFFGYFAGAVYSEIYLNIVSINSQYRLDNIIYINYLIGIPITLVSICFITRLLLRWSYHK